LKQISFVQAAEQASQSTIDICLSMKADSTAVALKSKWTQRCDATLQRDIVLQHCGTALQCNVAMQRCTTMLQSDIAAQRSSKALKQDLSGSAGQALLERSISADW